MCRHIESFLSAFLCLPRIVDVVEFQLAATELLQRWNGLFQRIMGDFGKDKIAILCGVQWEVFERVRKIACEQNFFAFRFNLQRERCGGWIVRNVDVARSRGGDADETVVIAVLLIIGPHGDFRLPETRVIRLQPVVQQRDSGGFWKVDRQRNIWKTATILFGLFADDGQAACVVDVHVGDEDRRNARRVEAVADKQRVGRLACVDQIIAALRFQKRRTAKMLQRGIAVARAEIGDFHGWK